MLNVLFVASEAYPFAKTGGLGDVLGALPSAFNDEVDARVIIPLYGNIPHEYKKSIHYIHHFKVEMHNTFHYCGLMTCTYNNIIFYFIDNEAFFKRLSLYGYFDDGERFSFFCRAVFDALPYLDFEPNILHCNDWQTAAIPYLLKHQYRNFFPTIKSVFSIHNMKYQGIYAFNDINDYLHLGFLPSDLEYYGQINLMKGGLYSADLITTVSPTYAEELKDPYYGEGLDGIVRDISDHEIGIINGIDETLYNPQTDPSLFVLFDSPDERKSKNKEALQKHLGLPVRKDIPMVSMITRLVEQKGLDLVANVIHEILQMDLQLVILGTGDAVYEHLLQNVAYSYPDKMITIIKFDEDLARKIYAGSDFFLMPSKFEPCGLSQMIAMRYGTVPIVRETGGLKDTITNFDPKNSTGNGFCFSAYNAHDMLFTIQHALTFYYKKPTLFHTLVQNAFNSHFDWKNSAETYYHHYKALLGWSEQ
jgi:starch synthase